jgi:hypothetical protein
MTTLKLIKEILIMDRRRDMDNYGNMIIITKEIGKKIRRQAMEKYILILERLIKEISKRDYLVDRESLLMWTKVFIRVNSKIVRRMEKELSLIKINPFMKVLLS